LLETDGAADAPNEGMAERIVRYFERMRAPRATRASVLWPENAIDTRPAEFGAVFEGDSILATARFESLPANAQVVLDIEFEAGDRWLRKSQRICRNCARCSTHWRRGGAAPGLSHSIV
jgi:hypothetical protein